MSLKVVVELTVIVVVGRGGSGFLSWLNKLGPFKGWSFGYVSKQSTVFVCLVCLFFFLDNLCMFAC